MNQLEMIDELFKRGAVRAIAWDCYTDQNGARVTQMAHVEFYPTDAMQEMLKKATAAGDTALVDVIKDLAAASDGGE